MKILCLKTCAMKTILETNCKQNQYKITVQNILKMLRKQKFLDFKIQTRII